MPGQWRGHTTPIPRRPSHPAAPIAFPSAQALTPNPRNAVAHAVRAVTGGPHALLGRVGSESADRFLMRNKDGQQALPQGVEAKVAISLSAFAEGGSALIDRNLDGGLSTGEAFPRVEGGGERRLTLPLEEFQGQSLPIYYLPPISPTGIQPDTVALCVAVNSTVVADIYSASKLADALVPVGFLEATSANPGHCLFHSSRALSVVEGAN